MNSIKDINNNIDHINTIKDISSIFEKIASIKINQIRHDVSARKEFYDTIWDIYVKLKAGNYKDDKLSKNQSKINKTAYVIVSSNSGLIGDMNNKIINLLKKEIKDKERYDVFVIGDKGKRILELEGIRYVKNYSFKDEVNDEFTKEILDDIEKYRVVSVLYEEYISLQEQNVKMQNLHVDVSTISKEDIIEKEEYIFEPSYKDVLDYFESVMKGQMFAQILYESQLSQYASRMIAMSTANSKATTLYNNETINLNKVKRKMKDENARILFESFKRKG
ncbi:MAG: F0F1 ATP synthase subunit gamma [Patescibacteria group bacterium]